MMKNIHDIDKIFKDGLEEHREAAPSSVWAALNHDLDKKQATHFREKYYRLKRVAVLALLLIVFSGGYMLYFSSSFKKATVANDSNTASAGKIEQPNTTGQGGVESKKDAATGSPEQQSSITPVNSEPAPTASVTNEKRKAAEPVATNNNTTAISQPPTANSTQNTSPAATDKESAHIIAQYNVAGEAKSTVNNLQHTNNKKIAGTNTKNTAGKVYALAPNEDRSLSLANTLDKNRNKIKDPLIAKNKRTVSLSGSDAGGEMANGFVNKESNQILHPVYSFIDQPAYTAFAWQPVTDIAHTSLPFNDSTAGNIRATIAKAAVRKNAASIHRFSLEGFGSANHSFKRLENDTRFSSPGRDKNEAEHFEQQGKSYSAGLLVNYAVSRHFSIQSGLVFTSSKTDIAAKTIYVRPDNNGHPHYELNCSSGYAYITPKTGTTPTVGDSIKIMGSNSTISYIGIPVSVSYVLKAGKFLVRPGVGVAVNLLTSGNSQTRFGNNSALSKQENTPINGLKTAYMDASLGLGIDYVINRRISVGVKPMMRWALTSINKNTPVQVFQNYSSMAAGFKINL